MQTREVQVYTQKCLFVFSSQQQCQIFRVEFLYGEKENILIVVDYLCISTYQIINKNKKIQANDTYLQARLCTLITNVQLIIDGLL